jgi:CxxC motif-containing protein (DUF1111 family)
MPAVFGLRRRSTGLVIGLRSSRDLVIGLRHLRTLALGALVVAGLSSIAAAAMTLEQRAAILAPTTDFSAAERFEALSGGSATNGSTLNRNAFSLPLANLSFEQRADFFVGNGLFRRNGVIAPSSTQGADGLGPLYNARGCQGCHPRMAGGIRPPGPTTPPSRCSCAFRSAARRR